jgi:hypothetical protein
MILLILLCECNRFFVYEKFTIKRTPYLGSELRIDGYYYLKHEKTRIYCFVFYSNGVVLNYSAVDLHELEEQFSKFPNVSTDKRLLWGPFIINGNELRFEEIDNSVHGQWLVCTVQCTILNDTTFRIDKGFLSHTGKAVPNRRTFEGEYHFRQYSPKPDSTNNVVK